jgi:biopolymer transport protein TolR
MFILIIFFLVASSFHEEERDIRVNLPESDPEMALSASVKVLVINVTREGRYYLGNIRKDIEGLQEALMISIQANPEQKVLIRGDRDARHGDVAAALATCRKAGVREANIGYVVWGSG